MPHPFGCESQHFSQKVNRNNNRVMLLLQMEIPSFTGHVLISPPFAHVLFVVLDDGRVQRQVGSDSVIFWLMSEMAFPAFHKKSRSG
jgi:hypothetical protein